MIGRSPGATAPGASRGGCRGGIGCAGHRDRLDRAHRRLTHPRRHLRSQEIQDPGRFRRSEGGCRNRSDSRHGDRHPDHHCNDGRSARSGGGSGNRLHAGIRPRDHHRRTGPLCDTHTDRTRRLGRRHHRDASRRYRVTCRRCTARTDRCVVQRRPRHRAPRRTNGTAQENRCRSRDSNHRCRHSLAERRHHRRLGFDGNCTGDPDHR